MIMNGQLLPHFSIEYRKHFTNFHATVVETAGGIQIGATEACMIMYGFQFLFAFMPTTNESASKVLNLKQMGLEYEFLDFDFTIGSVIALSTFVLSL